MAAFNKFNAFVADLAAGKHNLGSDTLKAALTDTAPTAANAVLTDITEIAGGNGYTAGGAAVPLTSSGQTGGTYKLVEGAVTWTSSSGAMGPFRYVVLYNATSATHPLIGWWDNGSAITLNGANGDQFVFTPDAVNGTIELQ